MPVVLNGVDEWLTLPLVLEPPFFMAAWVRADTSTAAMTAIWMGDPTSDDGDYSLFFPHDQFNNFWWIQRNGVSPGQGVLSANDIWTDGTWHHVLVATDAGGGLIEYFDGVKIALGSEPDPLLPAGTDTIAIGRRNDSTPTDPFDGAVTRPAAWTGLPTQFIVDQLAAGRWPGRVRPEDLRFFVPMVGSDAGHVDLVTGAAMTVNGTPTTAADPPGLDLYDTHKIKEPLRPVPVARAPVTNQNASATVTVAVNVTAGEHLIAVVHGHSSGAATAITALSSDVDGAFVVDVEQNYDLIDPGEYTGIGRLMNPTPGAHVITATLSGPPAATAIAVYRVTGLAADPLHSSKAQGLIAGQVDDEKLNWQISEAGMLAILGSTCAQALQTPVVAASAVGTVAYDVDWAALAGEYWGLAVDVSDRVVPLTGIQHPETTLRGYALVTAVYDGVAAFAGVAQRGRSRANRRRQRA